MTTGEGIFWGLATVGLVWLYVVTKDRWKWKRIALWSGAVLCIPVVGLMGYLGYIKWDESRPMVEAELWGIKMADSMDDVTFKKGKPTQTIDHDCPPNSAPCPLWVYTEDSIQRTSSNSWEAR